MGKGKNNVEGWLGQGIGTGMGAGGIYRSRTQDRNLEGRHEEVGFRAGTLIQTPDSGVKTKDFLCRNWTAW